MPDARNSSLIVTGTRLSSKAAMWENHGAHPWCIPSSSTQQLLLPPVLTGNPWMAPGHQELNPTGTKDDKKELMLVLEQPGSTPEMDTPHSRLTGMGENY